MSSPARIIQVGVNGYGRHHLEAIAEQAAAGRAALVAAVDPAPGGFAGAPVYDTLQQALAGHEADVVSIATPIGTHAALATLALEHGADVLLEKPPTASLAEFEQLQAVVERTGRAVQVGFQALGSDGIDVLQVALAEGLVGDHARVVAWGAWSRSLAYFARSAWAGHRVFNGRRVADGVVTNPLAHAVASALAVSGAQRADQVRWVDTELYRAHDIATDDTAWVEVGTTVGVPVQAALTLCAPTVTVDPSPSVAVVGDRGSVTFRYTDDEVDWRLADEPARIERVTRQGLLANLLDHRDTGAALLAPLVETGAFMSVLEASQTSPEPQPVDQAFVTWSGEGDDRAPIIAHIEADLLEVVRRGVPWSAVGAPWATAAPTRWMP
ncbi:Gfo/Idh/MocA family protein [Tessaracoccus sp. G1721]